MERKGSMLFGNNGSISLSKAGLAELRQERGGEEGKMKTLLNTGGDRRGQKVRGWE